MRNFTWLFSAFASLATAVSITSCGTGSSQQSQVAIFGFPAPIGTFIILGNHDHAFNAPKIESMNANGMWAKTVNGTEQSGPVLTVKMKTDPWGTPGKTYTFNGAAEADIAQLQLKIQDSARRNASKSSFYLNYFDGRYSTFPLKIIDEIKVNDLHPDLPLDETKIIVGESEWYGPNSLKLTSFEKVVNYLNNKAVR